MLPLGMTLVASALLPPPAQVPMGWGLGGAVDAVSGGGALLGTTMVGTVVTTVAAAAVAGLTRLVPPHLARLLLALAGGLGAGAVTFYVGTVLGTRLAGDPTQVGVGWVLLTVPGALAWGWTGYAVHGEHRPGLAEVRDRVPELDRVVPGVRPAGSAGVHEQVLLPWTSETGAPSLRWVRAFVAVVAVLVGALLLVSGERAGVVLVALLAGVGGVVLAHACTEVTAVVDERGLRLRSRRVPLTLLRVRADDVVGVGVADLDPLEWGGWGLRWLPDRTAYIGVGGPGLVVHRRSGRRLAVELSEGETAARAGALALRLVAAQALVETSSAC